MPLGWRNAESIGHMGWKCGYCGKEVGGDIGYMREAAETDKCIFICPRCENPTAFIADDYNGIRQFPAGAYGNDIDGLPGSVASIYDEVRRCIQYSAYTAAVLAMRKLLMHIAVEHGAPENLNFAEYVSFLEDAHWIPPNGHDWVDEVRKKGNEATHRIFTASHDDAVQLLGFVEMLLRFVYEFPAKMESN